MCLSVDRNVKLRFAQSPSRNQKGKMLTLARGVNCVMGFDRAGPLNRTRALSDPRAPKGEAAAAIHDRVRPSRKRADDRGED
jgi:hypothetical protein